MVAHDWVNILSKKFRVVQMQPHSRTGRPVPKSTSKQDSKVWKFSFEKKVPRAKRVFGTFDLVCYEVLSNAPLIPAGSVDKIFIQRVRSTAHYKAAIGGLRLASTPDAAAGEGRRRTPPRAKAAGPSLPMSSERRPQAAASCE